MALTPIQTETYEKITTQITLPVTEKCTVESVKAFMFEPECIININPLVISCVKLPPKDSVDVSYEVEDEVVLLGGLTTTKSKYTADFTMIGNEMRVKTAAGLGVSTVSLHTIEQIGDEIVVTEDCMPTVPFLLRRLVIHTIKQAHFKMFDRILEKFTTSSEEQVKEHIEGQTYDKLEE
ncbi:hypothetical protein V1512DRAFT_265721 [Lipomyces arxii]|uniref:uncharacterized protein n=1 Tax=Lipomyces arxii TaxID=56418 RepID=UPI0034CFE910